MRVLKKPFFSSGSATSRLSAKIFNLEQKKQIYLFSIFKYLKKYEDVF